MKIYYDPLLTRIQKQAEGYYMEELKYGDMRIQEKRIFRYKINSLAYMDDTIYISQDKKQMEKILKTVEEFSLITGTQINAEKSHLICINNLSKNKEERSIKFMGEEINAKDKGEHVRILGVWMSANGKKQYQKK